VKLKNHTEAFQGCQARVPDNWPARRFSAEEETCNMDVNNVVELHSSEEGQIEVNDVSMLVPVLESHSEPGDRLSHFAAMFLLNAKECYQLIQSSLNFFKCNK